MIDKTFFHFSCNPTGLPFYIGFVAPSVLLCLIIWCLLVIILVSLLFKKPTSSPVHSIKDSAHNVKISLFMLAVSVTFAFSWTFGLLATSNMKILRNNVQNSSLLYLSMTQPCIKQPSPVQFWLNLLFITSNSLHGILLLVLNSIRPEVWLLWTYMKMLLKKANEEESLLLEDSHSHGRKESDHLEHSPSLIAKPSASYTPIVSVKPSSSQVINKFKAMLQQE